jgi:tRNA A37 methylthiotransferase MiaB
MFEKCLRNFAAEYQGNCSYGVNIGIMERGIWKPRTYFLELVQELDKVEGIERLRISSIEPNLKKNETICFEKQNFCTIFIFAVGK